MAYATEQDMIDRFGERELQQLTDRVAATAIDAGVLAGALGDAAAEIDSWLAKRMTTPLSPVPALVTSQCCTIARYRLHKDTVPDGVRNAYLDAVKWLQAAARGDVTIDGVTPGATAASADMPLVEGPDRVFGRDAMRAF